MKSKNLNKYHRIVQIGAKEQALKRIGQGHFIEILKIYREYVTL